MQHCFTSTVNLDELHAVCKTIQPIIESTHIKKEFEEMDKELASALRADPSFAVFSSLNISRRYNIFNFPYGVLRGIYNEIKEAFNTLKNDNKQYYIKAWLNVYPPGVYVKWHPHFEHHYYGHYTVRGEGTITEYEDGNYVNKNGVFVISEPDRRKHRSHPEKEERITIGYDIASEEYINRNFVWVSI